MSKGMVISAAYMNKFMTSLTGRMLDIAEKYGAFEDEADGICKVEGPSPDGPIGPSPFDRIKQFFQEDDGVVSVILDDKLTTALTELGDVFAKDKDLERDTISMILGGHTTSLDGQKVIIRDSGGSYGYRLRRDELFDIIGSMGLGPNPGKFKFKVTPVETFTPADYTKACVIYKTILTAAMSGGGKCSDELFMDFCDALSTSVYKDNNVDPPMKFMVFTVYSLRRLVSLLRIADAANPSAKSMESAACKVPSAPIYDDISSFEPVSAQTPEKAGHNEEPVKTREQQPLKKDGDSFGSIDFTTMDPMEIAKRVALMRGDMNTLSQIAMVEKLLKDNTPKTRPASNPMNNGVEIQELRDTDGSSMRITVGTPTSGRVGGSVREALT